MIAKKKAQAHSRSRSDGADAFIPDPAGGPAHSDDSLAEELAEGFLASATSGEDQGEEWHEQVVAEERGGPFVPSSARKEFAMGTDASNPAGAEKAAFPTTRSKRRLAPPQ